MSMNGLNRLNIYTRQKIQTHTHCVILNWTSDREKRNDDDEIYFILSFVLYSFVLSSLIMYIHIQEKEKNFPAKEKKTRTSLH